MIPEAVIWAVSIGAFCLGSSIGALIGMAMVWDKRFDAGRRYGYAQGKEWRRDENVMTHIRSLM